MRNDRKAFQDSKDWIYNNLAEGLRVARETGRPLMVVFRCIPCAACQEFDDDVARRDPIIRDPPEAGIPLILLSPAPLRPLRFLRS